MSETNQSLPPQAEALPMVWTAAAALLLVAFGDLLLFDVRPGVNLFAFSLGVAAVLAGLAAARRPAAAVPALAAAAGLALPLIEATSLPGLLLAALGLAVATLVAFRMLPDRLEPVPGTLLRFGVVAPFRLPGDLLAGRAAAGDGLGQRLRRGLLVWSLPLGLSLVFLMLFAAANPLIEAAMLNVHADTVLRLLNPVRIVFWLLLAFGIWALLRPRLLRPGLRAPIVEAAASPESAWFGHAAILRSLLVFNALFAVQTVLDLAYLWGGVTLPDGMSYAQYAHRGAYPLMVTALLAAAFVLAAMRRDGPGDRSPFVRGLVYAFIGQNVLLCLSAILRLNLYVEVYSLTELRLAAGIWMGLVACGLVLILLRIVLRRSNAWLVASNLLALLVVLYASAILDYAALIARFNIEHSRELSGRGEPLDVGYLGELGPSVIPALDAFIGATDARVAAHRAAVDLRQSLAARVLQAPADPRSWTWRRQRLLDYLGDQTIAIRRPATQNQGGMQNQKRS